MVIQNRYKMITWIILSHDMIKLMHSNNPHYKVKVENENGNELSSEELA